MIFPHTLIHANQFALIVSGISAVAMPYVILELTNVIGSTRPMMESIAIHLSILPLSFAVRSIDMCVLAMTRSESFDHATMITVPFLPSPSAQSMTQVVYEFTMITAAIRVRHVTLALQLIADKSANLITHGFATNLDSVCDNCDLVIVMQFIDDLPDVQDPRVELEPILESVIVSEALEQPLVISIGRQWCTGLEVVWELVEAPCLEEALVVYCSLVELLAC